MKNTLLIILILNVLNAKQDITLDWLNSKPRTIAKDFYIWRYLDQDITPSQAIKALGEAKNVNYKLLERYANKLQHKETSNIVKCIKMDAKSLLKQNANCIEVGMSIFKATELSSNQLEQVINKVKNIYPDSAKKFKILDAVIPFTKLVSSPSDIFFDTFNQCGGAFRVKSFNYRLPKSTIKRLMIDKRFSQTIKLIVTNPKLTTIQKSLLTIDATNLNHKSIFYLAINAIRHNKNNLALKFLDLSYKNAYFQHDKDKVLFWQHKLTNKSKYLKKLSQSWDNNIYSLLAFEKMNIVPKNIVYKLDDNLNTKIDYNYKDPFNWLFVLDDTKKVNKSKMDRYNNLLNHKKTLGHLAFIKERFFGYKKSFFVTPFEDIVDKLDVNRQALIYAIARQESRFIPTSISSAYAMGVMQIMPFLSRAIAKELKDFYDIDDQLDPKTNLKYANHHLNFLENKLKHPLLIAYAYNGGIGFTKRMLKSGLFQEGKYEPFLSMEMLPYDETKLYGKKVLANYFIYKNHLDKKNKIKLSTLFQMLKSPLAL
jgi:soluble lytic murein transglycosylase